MKPKTLALMEIKCWRAFDASMQILRGKRSSGSLKIWAACLGLLCLAAALAAWHSRPGSAGSDAAPASLVNAEPGDPQNILVYLTAEAQNTYRDARPGVPGRFAGAWLVVHPAGTPRLFFLPARLPADWPGQPDPGGLPDEQLLQALQANGLTWDAVLPLDARALKQLERAVWRSGAVLPGGAPAEMQQAALFDLACDRLAELLPGVETGSACEFPTLTPNWMFQYQHSRAADSSLR